MYIKRRTFKYIGEKPPAIDWHKNEQFLLQIENAALLTLENKKLLTAQQREWCVKYLENQTKKVQGEAIGGNIF